MSTAAPEAPTQVTPPSAEEWISTFLDSLGENAIPCDHVDHVASHKPVDAPAEWRVWIRCPACPAAVSGNICNSGYERYFQEGVFECHACGGFARGIDYLTRAVRL